MMFRSVGKRVGLQPKHPCGLEMYIFQEGGLGTGGRTNDMSEMAMEEGDGGGEPDPSGGL